MASEMNRRTFARTITLLSICLLLVAGCTGSTPGPVVVDTDLDADLTSGELVLLKFGAKWCGPCRMLDAELEKLAEQEPQLKIVEVDVDTNKALARKYKVNQIPDMVLVRSNEILDRQVGYFTVDEISGWVQGF